MGVRRMRTVVAVMAVGALVAGCTIGGGDTQESVGAGSSAGISTGAGAALSGAVIRVGSKEYDEQLLLGQIAVVALESAGAEPADDTNITGSDNVRASLTAGSIDLYWEYTGTAWTSFLKKTDVIDDPEKLFEAVKRTDADNDVTWMARSPANNTFAIAVGEAAAGKYDVTSMSDLATLATDDPAAVTMCVDAEFRSRDDGLPGLEKAYDFTVAPDRLRIVNVGVLYTTIGEDDACNFGVVSATDGRVAAQRLTLLEDDEKFFPVYNPAISVRSEVAAKYPQLEQLMDPIAAALDSETLTALNKKVSVDGGDVREVATSWLKSQGFIA